MQYKFPLYKKRLLWGWDNVHVCLFQMSACPAFVSVVVLATHQALGAGNFGEQFIYRLFTAATLVCAVHTDLASWRRRVGQEHLREAAHAHHQGGAHRWRDHALSKRCDVRVRVAAWQYCTHSFLCSLSLPLHGGGMRHFSTSIHGSCRLSRRMHARERKA